MKAQEELEKILNDTDVKCKEAKLECEEEELLRLRSSAEKVTSTMEGEAVSRTRELDPMGKIMALIEAKEKQIEAMKQEIETLKEIGAERAAFYKSIVYSLKKPIYIKVLHGRYFLGKSLEDIAEEVGYTYRNICYIHGDALQAVDAELKEKGLA